MADALCAKRAANAGNYVVRRYARGFVDNKKSVHILDSNLVECSAYNDNQCGESDEM